MHVVIVILLTQLQPEVVHYHDSIVDICLVEFHCYGAMSLMLNGVTFINYLLPLRSQRRVHAHTAV